MARVPCEHLRGQTKLTKVSSAHGFAFAVGPHRTFVDAARDPVIVGARFPEPFLEKRQALRNASRLLYRRSINPLKSCGAFSAE